MKRSLIATIFVLFIISAQAGSWSWGASLTSTGMVRAWDLADSYGSSSTWVGGQYDGVMSFGPDQYPSTGLADAFVAKYSLDGTPLWFKHFGSPDEDVCLSIEAGTNGSDNCYFTGYFNSVMSVDGINLTSAGMWDVFFGKLAPNGDLLWLKRFGGPLNDIGYGISVDHEDNVIVAGWFADTIDFGGGISISSYGGSDMFVAKFDPLGNCLWARHGGNEGVDYGYKVDCSYTGSIFVTGVAGQGASFDGLSQSPGGLFVAKYTWDGDIQWVSSALNAGPINIGIGKNDLIQYRGMVTGRVTGTAIFGDHVISSMGNTDDIFLAEFSPADGSWTSVQRWGGSGSDKGRAVHVHDYLGYLAVASYENSVSFGGTPIDSNGNWDCVLLKDNPQPLAVGFGSINVDVVTDVKRVFPDRAVTCGWYSGIMRLGQNLLDSGSDAIQSGFIAMYDFDAVAVDDHVQAPQTGLRCYPNPFSANIMIQARESSGLYLDIYNQRGQKIRSLTANDARNGYSNWTWDGLDSLGRRCPSGIYTVRGSGKQARVLLIN